MLDSEKQWWYEGHGWRVSIYPSIPYAKRVSEGAVGYSANSTANNVDTIPY